MRRPCSAPSVSSRRRGSRLCALLALFLFGAATANAQQKETRSAWQAGAYSFSDELGGFRITGISGIGTLESPVVISQQFDSASPVTLVIRALGPVRPFGRPGVSPNGFLNLHFQTLNNSGFAWIEFEFELQEFLRVPSVFGDGLSFDQRRTASDTISSGSFRQFSRDFEPYDRVLFRQGKVDPGAVGSFGFLVTDVTPRATFYLVQDPRIPFS